MNVTVAMCTWNRPAMLRRTLEHLAAVRVPAGLTWELLVVVNGDADESARVVRAMASRLPIRLGLEPEVGLARARNRVLAEATGEYLIWTDDDVRPDPAWLEAYVDAFRRYPSTAIFGGPIRPWFAAEPPRWMRDTLSTMRSAHGIVDFGPEECALTPTQVPYGANMAFRTAVEQELPFDLELGVVGRKRQGGEETMHVRGLLARGHTGVWVPGAIIDHFIPRAHMTRRYLRRYNHAYGRVLAQTTPPDPTSVARLLGRPRWAIREAIVQEMRYWTTRWTASSTIWVDAMQRASRAWGILSASR